MAGERINDDGSKSQDDIIDYEEFEDFNQVDMLKDEDAKELVFDIDERYRGDPEYTELNLIEDVKGG